jgi:tetratricopeptide (TPR) repeat protein
MGSGFCLVRYFGLRRESDEKRRNTLYAWGLFLFLCALLSKTVTCSLPAVMALLLWWKRGRISGREWLVLSPLFALGLASGLMTAWLERAHVGAEGLEWSYAFLGRCLIAGRVLWFYAGKLFWPDDLSFNYPRWEIDAGIWWQYLYPAGVLAAVGLLWKFRGKLGRGPLVAVLFFCGVLFPALGFFDVYPFRFSFVADHFQYHASIGLIVLGTAASVRLSSYVPQSGLSRIRPLFSSAALLLLACLTFVQTGIYRNLDTLWEHTLKKNPDSWLAHNNLGNLLLNRGDFEGALEHHKKALSLRPDKEVSLTNLGHTMATAGRILEAETYYLEAIRANPRHAEAHYNLGVMRMRQNRMEDALRQYIKVLEIRPDHAEAHTNLGLLMAQSGKKEEALAHLRSAIAIRPDLLEARMALGRMLAANGDFKGAEQEFYAAQNIKPDIADAHLHLGLVLGLQGRFDESVIHLSEAVRLNPDSAEARMRLSQTLWLAGQKEAAVKELETLGGLDERRAEELEKWIAARRSGNHSRSHENSD